MIRAAAAVLGLSLMMSAAAQAQFTLIGSVELTNLQCNSVTLSIHLSNKWEASPNPNTSVYKVFDQIGPRPTISSDNSTIQLTNLQPGTTYDFLVNARSRHAGGWGIPIYRPVDEPTFITPACTTPAPVAGATPAPGDIRLRHEATGKCIFGNPGEAAIVKTWTCWKDPGMAVSLEPLGGSEVRIRMRSVGKCLFGNPVPGKEVKNFTCWTDLNMVYIVENLGGNRVRLRHKNTGQCMYAGPVDGNAVKNYTCWNDPQMVWVKDPF